MEKHLFIVRSPLGKEIYSAELPVNSRLIPIAQTIMDEVSAEHPNEIVECCEIWERTAHHTMNLLATAF